MKKVLMLLVVLLAVALCIPAQAASHGVHYVCGEKTCTHPGTAHSGGWFTWTEWDGKSFAQNSTVYCYLTKNVEVSSTIMVPPGARVYLCLNGYSITQTDRNKNVFTVYGQTGNRGELVICDCTSTAGTILHSRAGTGHGVGVGPYGYFYMYDGTIKNSATGVYAYGPTSYIYLMGGDIRDNQQSGVHLSTSSSQLNMYGGIISDNQKYGVNLSAASAAFNMYGGAINGNYDTGVMISAAADMVMTGGEIKENITGITMMGENATVKVSGGTIAYNMGELGGGVYVAKGTFTLSGGEITNNAAESGGGVYAYSGIFNQTGGSIKNNRASGGIGTGINSYVGYGGGVFVSGCKYTLTGGSVSNNQATVKGGGIYVHSKNCLTIGGGVITGNNARQSGGGVYMSEYAGDLYIRYSGAKITGNSVGGWYSSNEVTQQYVSNIHLTNTNQRVEVAPSVSSGEFGVTCAGVTRYPHPFVYCTGSSMNASRLSMFTADDPALSTNLSTGTPVNGVLVQKIAHTHKICGTSTDAECTHALDRHYNDVTWNAWDGTFRPILKSGSNYLYLTNDNADATEIQVDAGQTLYLCLNGHNLIRPGNNLVTVSIYNGGQMILCDCADSDAQGMISNNYANEAMLVSNSGSFTMYGGSLANSTSSGIVCENENSVVNMFGGKIANNVGGYAGNGRGCGIFMRYGTLNMYGGVISGNSADRANGKGGGVYLGYDYLPNATMNMYGGMITGNSLTGSGSVGGGIYVASCGILNLYGGTITGNTAATAGGVKMDISRHYQSQLYVQGNVTIANNVGGNLDIQNPFARTGVVTGNIGITLPQAPTETKPANFAHSCTGMTDEELARFVSDQGYANKRVYGDYAQFYVPVTKYALTTAASPAEGGTVTSGGSYAAGETVSLSAEANAGYKFTGWEVVSGSLTLTDDQKKSATISFSMPAGELSIRANFTRVTVTIKAEITQHIYSGVIRVDGREDARSHEFTVDYGTEVTLTAIPDTGYYANGWRVVNGSEVSNKATYTFVATADVALWAYIAPNEYDFVIRVSPENSGTAKSVELDATQGQYKYGFGGTLKAEANEGYTFLRWEVTKGEGTFDDPAAAETYFSIGLGDVEITAIFVNAHSHAICGETVIGADCAMPNHDGHAENVVFLPWDGSTELYFESGMNYFYLTDDVVTDKEIRVNNGGTLHLCLNGKKLISGATNAINVDQGSALVLCDCVDTLEHPWGQITRKENTYGRGIYSAGRMEMYGGHITGHDTSSLTNRGEGGGILAWPGSHFTLYGGEISNNKAGFEGGGVYYYRPTPGENGDFVMYGGRIHHNYAEDDGGGVTIAGGHFIMHGGVIDYNTAKNDGGGIHNAGRITICDGGVAYNTAGRDGGGICSLTMAYHTVTMKGGYIGHNVAGRNAGGLNFGDGLFFSGEAGIALNKAGTGDALRTNNIFLYNGEQITIEGDLTRLLLGRPEVLGITLSKDPTTAPVPYVKRADGSVTQDDLAHTFSDAVFNDASMAEFYNKRINADGLGEFAPNEYTLTLVNAKLADNSTGGSFAKGTQINAVAVVPAGQLFIEWTADGMTLTDEQKQNATLAFTMPANAVTLTARCASVVARVDDTEFTDFAEALSAWNVGTTLTLLADVSSNEMVALKAETGTTKILDLNGKTWTGTSSAMMWVYSNVTLTIKDTASGGCLKNANASASSVVTVNNAGNLNFENGKMTAVGTETSGIVAHLTSGTIAISGGTIDVQGNCVASNGAVTVSGAPVLSGGQSTFHLAGNGKVTIQAGTAIPENGWKVYNDAIAAGVVQGTNIFLPDDYYLMDTSGKLVTKLESGDSAYIKTHKHTLAYMADDVLDTINYGCICGYTEGSVKLVIPAGQLVYDGNAKPAAVEGDLTGYTLTYQYEDGILEGEPTEYGAYQAILVLGGVEVSAEYTILPTISEADVYSVYSVTHYQEQLDGTYAEVEADTQFPLQAKVGDTVTAAAKNYLGYTYNAEKSTDSAVLSEAKPGADGQPVFTKLELYYTLNSYSITFMSDGAEYAKLTQKYGSAVTEPEAPSKDGYTFQGWDAEVPETMPANAVTLTAKWAANSSGMEMHSVYSVTHYQEQQDGTYAEVAGDSEFPLQGEVGEEVKAEPKTYTGYSYNAEKSTASATLAQAAPGADGKPVYTKLELYYDLNSYTITFMSEGAEYAKLTQKYGSQITAPAAPEKAGWVFDGWDQTIPATMPATDLTITAKWKAVAPTATPTAKPSTNPLMIIKHPTDQVVAAGENAVFTTVAIGDGVSYQWYINRNDGRGWVKIQGATNSEYLMPTVELAFDGFQYACEVRDMHGNALYTNAAVLYVVAQPDIPQTGDHTSVMTLCALLLLSGAGCYVLMKKRQRYN